MANCPRNVSRGVSNNSPSLENITNIVNVSIPVLHTEAVAFQSIKNCSIPIYFSVVPYFLSAWLAIWFFRIGLQTK